MALRHFKQGYEFTKVNDSTIIKKYIKMGVCPCIFCVCQCLLLKWKGVKEKCKIKVADGKICSTSTSVF